MDALRLNGVSSRSHGQMRRKEVRLAGIRWTSVAATDRGRVRPKNEDAFLEHREAGLFAVADGMGGHAAGEVASRIAVDALERQLARNQPADDSSDPLVRSYVLANREIRRRGRVEPEKRGMGTTMSVLLVKPQDQRGMIAHVGDSRVYRFRAGTLEQLTKDHTWVQERVDAGVLSEKGARNHPYSSILTRVLGTDEAVVPDVIDVEIEDSDLFLLCSDGLTGMVADASIAALLAADNSLTDKIDSLIAAAWEAGAIDNVTAILVQFRDA
jgi:PPM family protein phosphatase